MNWIFGHYSTDFVCRAANPTPTLNKWYTVQWFQEFWSHASCQRGTFNGEGGASVVHQSRHRRHGPGTPVLSVFLVRVGRYREGPVLRENLGTLRRWKHGRCQPLLRSEDTLFRGTAIQPFSVVLVVIRGVAELEPLPQNNNIKKSYLL